MSAKVTKIIRISIQNGDAIDSNRLQGKSNTGTYFISSEQDYLEVFKEYIDDSGTKAMFYYLDFNRVKAYCSAFKALVLPMETYKFAREVFPINAAYFDKFTGNEKIKVSTRKNDTRYFLQFDNKNPIIAALRNVLYGLVSCLVFEKISDNEVLVYPELNYTNIK